MTSMMNSGASPLDVVNDRLEDYLNDKLQTTADLQNLDTLISNVENQRKLLQDQLRDAQAKLAASKKASEDHKRSMIKQTNEFQSLQMSIDERTRRLAASDSTEEAVKRLQGPLERLRRLELAQSYVELLKEVNELADEARSHLPANPKEALKPYTRLKELAMEMQALQSPADGAAIHLVTYVNDTARQLWLEMKKIMSNEFEMVLQKTKWPASSDSLTQEWKDCFVKLLDLQAPEFIDDSEPIILLPMAVLTKSFVQQFKYNFMTQRSSSIKGKPDIYFDWFIATVRKWEDFLQEKIGPVLANHFRDSPLATNSLFIDPLSAFIAAYLPVMREKLNSVLPNVSKDPQQLSSFMFQLINFDDSLRNDFKYDGGDSKNGFKGLTWEILDVWFDRWLEVETNFALARYLEIIEAKESGFIDYDSAATGKTKPTFGAIRVIDLLSSITTLYERIRKFSRKLRFLIDVQLAILDRYHNRLRDSLDAYQAITSTVGRTLHGVTKEQQAALQGIGGLESLCKVYSSADHVIITLRDWSNSIFFIDLWTELQERAKRSDSANNFAGPKSFADVRSSTSASVGSADDGALFDEISRAFEARRDHAQSLLIEALQYPLHNLLKPYTSKPQWTSIDDDIDVSSDLSTLMVTAELDQPLQTINRNMSFLHRTIAEAPFRRIWREVFKNVQEILWNEVLMTEKFTTLGAAQFLRDLTAIWAVIDAYVVHGSSSALGMPRVAEGARLLNLPLVAKEGSLSIMDVNDRIFVSNSDAKMVVEELGLSSLDYSDARRVVQRRIECAD